MNFQSTLISGRSETTGKQILVSLNHSLLSLRKDMKHLSDLFLDSFHSVFNYTGTPDEFIINFCSPDFKEDYTLIIFSWSKKFNLNPEQLGQKIGNYLVDAGKISSYSIIKGFFNFSLPDLDWIEYNKRISANEINHWVKTEEPIKNYLIEYCSPNTNKPLHLGHIRNILLGWSVFKILSAIGHHVETCQIINDRGVAICKSMLAWKKYSNGQTPDTLKIKPDHFVGEYYVLFETKLREEYLTFQNSTQGKEVYEKLKGEDETEQTFFKRYKNEYFNSYSQLGGEVRNMLLEWENNNQEIITLWKKMNAWVYDGFEQTYNKLNVSFDYYYYESQTYLLGKDIITEGLKNGIFYQGEDKSVWINLEDIGLDKKILMRIDGTSVYITQDLGTARLRHQTHNADHYIYVVADEQDYHFKVLFATLKKLQEDYANGLLHLSYGMVDLPEGKMKSREGTVVDADDLIEEVINEALSTATERGEISSLPEFEQREICTKIAMSALKYFILKVSAKKRMVFNPKESVDMQGNTGPYIVNAYVRIQSILRKSVNYNKNPNPETIYYEEKSLIKLILIYPSILNESAKTLDPSHLANYLYTLAKDFHKYYHDFKILSAESNNIIEWRLLICENIGQILKHGMDCLGIQLPERM
jgi:arginyl-tRNA synthetase